MQNRNFDDLAEKFIRNIYGSTKGQLRHAILWQELDLILASLPSRPLSIIDIGGGQGQIASALAARGHQVLLCDISEEMLKIAKKYAKEQGVDKNLHFFHTSAQALSQIWNKPVDLLLCHAVLEWVSEPKAFIAALWNLLSPGAILSLMFYNQHALTLKTAIEGNFLTLQKGTRKKTRRSLLPDYPRDPRHVYVWLEAQGFIIERRTGVRVFHDYVYDREKRTQAFEQLLALETEYCRQEPFLHLGRYIHVTAKKPC